MICHAELILASHHHYLGVTPPFDSAQGKRGRALRYNLFARASQKGFPLQSLTQMLTPIKNR